MTTDITTETTTETTPTTVDFAALVATATALQAAVETAQLAYEAALRDVSAVKPTFEMDGVWYQIRHREDSKLGRPLTYLCKLEKGEPKNWLGGKRGPRAKKVEATMDSEGVQETAAMQHVVDGVASEAETVIID